jgi:hypothetical protein
VNVPGGVRKVGRPRLNESSFDLRQDVPADTYKHEALKLVVRNP